ncbi:Oidioi.mRNA.OKI2018_I69.PAR.g12875.t1.cds [Oikopleura dioica]|uniref:Oidioi.mRNA.OKI2018_I69.PAR.g12875.t1.cds n=1 Tax=Oikopleura dioica TaxID=34765 RepID=A0ABN7S229_OIKDI|nr:Oidioi.mRNA.OKI2018_I69.PAR.g12875.t1.cds [Oikopleura dioica]
MFRKTSCPKGRRKLLNGKIASGSVSSIARQAVVNGVSAEVPPHIKQRREQQLARFREREKKKAEIEAKKAAEKVLYDKYVKRPKFFYGDNNYKEGVIITFDQNSPKEELNAYAGKDRIQNIIMKDSYKIEGDYFMTPSTMDYPVLRITLDALPDLDRKQKEILDNKLSSLRAPKVSTKEVQKQISETRPTNNLNHQKQTASGTTKNLTPSSTQLPPNIRPSQPPAPAPRNRPNPHEILPPPNCAWWPPHPEFIVIDRNTPEEVKSQYAPKNRMNGIIGSDWCKIEGEYLIARKSVRYPVTVKIRMDALDLDLIHLRKLVHILSSSGVPDSLAKLLEEKESNEAKRKAEARARKKAARKEVLEVDLNARIDPQDLDTSPYKENVDPSRKRLMPEQPVENNPSKKAKISVNPF